MLKSDTVTLMETTLSLSIKELHAKTGEQVRRAQASRNPVMITDRGKLVAFLISPRLVQKKTRKRTLLPEYKKFLSREKISNDVLDHLDAVRGDR
ncbi:MAG: hypothetical protein ACH346_03820 [Chthoniobacterales bacterium]